MKTNLLKRATALVMAYLISFHSSSALAISMQSMFDNVNGAVNTTNGGAIKGQSANFYTGGSLYMRVPTKNYQIASVSLPKVSAGCGGIDAQAGGFSFINGEALTSMFRNIMAQAGPYFFSLALKSICEPCHNVMAGLKEMADAVNRFNINSCQAAQGVATAAWDVVQGNQTKISAQTFGVASNTFSDFAEGWTRFSNGLGTAFSPNKSEQTSILNSAKSQSPDAAAQVDKDVTTGNLIWKALVNLNSSLNSGSELSSQEFRMMMGLVGTVILKEDATLGSVPVVRPMNLITLDQLIGRPGDQEIYLVLPKCVDSQDVTDPFACQVVSVDNTNPANKERFVPMIKIVEDRMQAVVNAINNRTALPQEAISFIEMVDDPVLQMLSVAQSLPNANATAAVIGQYSELIAAKFTAMYVDLMLDGLMVALGSLGPKVNTTANQAIDRLVGDVRKAKEDNRARVIQIAGQIGQHRSMVTQLQEMESRMYGAMSATTRQNLMFGQR